MSRPKPSILSTVETDDGIVWDITHTDRQYIITYKDQPCGIRKHISTLTNNGFKYQKLSYNNIGSARAQVRRLNQKFKCVDFGYKEI